MTAQRLRLPRVRASPSSDSAGEAAACSPGARHALLQASVANVGVLAAGAALLCVCGAGTMPAFSFTPRARRIDLAWQRVCMLRIRLQDAELCLVPGLWDTNMEICAGAMPYRRDFRPLPRI